LTEGNRQKESEENLHAWNRDAQLLQELEELSIDSFFL
jgi:hypothetical protein